MADIDNRMTRGYDGTASVSYSIFRCNEDQFQEIVLYIYGRSYYRPEIYSTCRESVCEEEKGVELISVLDENSVDWLDRLSKDEFLDIAFKLDEAVVNNIKDIEKESFLSDLDIHKYSEFFDGRSYYFI